MKLLRILKSEKFTLKELQFYGFTLLDKIKNNTIHLLRGGLGTHR